MNRRLLLLCVVLCACGGPIGPAALTSAPAFPGDADPSYADACFAFHEQILSDVATIARAHAAGCSVDADCARLDVTISCQESCSMAVLAAQLASAKDDLAAYAAHVCPVAPKTCFIEPACAQVQATCVEGTCRPLS